MPDKDDMSIDDILAAARGEGKGGPSQGKPSKGEPSKGEASKGEAPDPEGVGAAAPAPPAGGKKPTEMSIEEMMAAARGGAAKPAADKGGGAKSAGAGKGDAAAGGKKPTEMSIEEMMAAARGGAGAAKPAAGKPAAAKKPAAGKPAAEKPAAEKPAAAADSGHRETSSVFAGPKPSKPGPISKAEAAERAKEAPSQSQSGRPQPRMPERPAFLRPPEPAASDAEDRRGFFAAVTGVAVGSSLALGFSSLAVTNLLWVLGLARFMFPNILTEPPTRFKVGFPDEYAPGQVQTKFKAQFGVWIVRADYEGQPQIYALQSVCTHLGCTPNWLDGEQKFKCPCHGSGFYIDGINFEGPAPRPLERFAIRVSDDGQLEVDKSRKFQEELGQWSDSSSFVPV